MVKEKQPDPLHQYMVTGIPTAAINETAGQVLKRLRAPRPLYDSIGYVYIVDDDKKLLGAVSLRDIINKSDKISMRKLMPKRLISARPNTDKKQIARLAIKHRLKAIPIVNGRGTLLGVVPPRKIFNILHLAHTEDMLKVAGVHNPDTSAAQVIESGIIRMSIFRLPSLLIGLLVGLGTTFVLQNFQQSLESHIVLTFFIPIVLYLSAATGTQTGTILIRTLATGTVAMWRYIARELFIGLTIATVIGGAMFVISYALYEVMEVALIIGLSLFFSITTASVLGILVPWLLSAMKKDPAVSGGPLINVIQDILTLLVYFSVAGFFIV